MLVPCRAGDSGLPKAALDFAIYAIVGVGAVLLILLVRARSSLCIVESREAAHTISPACLVADSSCQLGSFEKTDGRAALWHRMLALASYGCDDAGDGDVHQVALCGCQVNPLATLLMMASVAMVIVYLYGELWILGLRFNECAATPPRHDDGC